MVKLAKKKKKTWSEDAMDESFEEENPRNLSGSKKNCSDTISEK